MSDGAGRGPVARRPTMGDIANHLGVSRQLVSAVLRDAPGASPANRERVHHAVRELGYSPHVAAQMLRRTRSRHIGVLFSLDHPFDLDVVDHLYGDARARGYGVVLAPLTATRSENLAVHELLGFRTEGIVLLGPNLLDREIKDFARTDPVVVFGRRSRSPGIDCIRTDDASGIGAAVTHLVEHGHRDIAHVDGADLPAARSRRAAYLRAMRAHGLPDSIRVVGGSYSEEAGAAAARRLLEDATLPTAVIAGNDQSAVGIIDVLIRAGVRVPEDVSVVGFDDSSLARMSYRRLTTVRQDARQVAAAAVAAVVQRLEGKASSGTDLVIPTSLVVRDTTGPVRSDRR